MFHVLQRINRDSSICTFRVNHLFVTQFEQ